MRAFVLMLLLSSPSLAQTDTTLRLEKTASGAVRRLPVDTLVIGGRRIIGVAVPSRAFYAHGDLNLDGNVSTADIIQLIQSVLFARALPAGDTIAMQVLYTFGKDSTLYTFLPKRGTR